MTDYPVHVDVTSPARFERVQVLLRIGLAVVLAIVGVTAGRLVGLLYVALPIFAAVAVSSKGSEHFMTAAAPKLWRVLAWLLQLEAYMLLLVDRFPAYDENAVIPSIRFTGRPSVGSALVRLVTSLPSGALLLVLWFVSSLLWVVGAICVLVAATMPHAVLAFQCGVLRWQARLVAYHASLVVEYPPWSFDSDASEGNVAAAAGAR